MLHAVRRALATAGTPGDVVALRDDLVVLGPDGGVHVDLDALEGAARRAETSGATADYRAALALAEPDLLPEDAFEPWTEGTRSAIGVRRSTLRLGLAGALEQAGRTVEAIADIRASEEGREGVQAFLQKRRPGWLPSQD